MVGRLLILKSIRASLLTTVPASHASSPLSRSTIQLYQNSEPMKALVNAKGIQHVSSLRRCVQRCYTTISYGIISRRNCAWGSVLGVSTILGSTCLGPHIAYADYGFDILENACHSGVSEAASGNEDPRSIMDIAVKLMLPFLLFVTVLMNWECPVILATKVILVLVGTKPSPLSIYVFIEQLKRRFMEEKPFLYRFKSLYANRVEVEDYAVLCLARVELKDHKFTLIGVLGSWWVLPQESFTVIFQDKVMKYIRN